MEDVHSSRLNITLVPTNSLNPCPWNPRTWDDTAKHHLSESIERFGFVDPLIVNEHPERKNIIIGGHFRWTVAKELGITEVPVVFVSLTEDKERELNLRLNKNVGEWNFDYLKDFDLSLLLDVGFDQEDLGHIWNDSLEISLDTSALTKSAGASQERKTKPGDLYRLGAHTLCCGHLIDKSAIERVTRGTPANAVYLDTTRLPEHGLLLHPLKTVLQNALSHSQPDCHVFSWSAEEAITALRSVYEELGLKHAQTCLRLTSSSPLSYSIAFHTVTEPCLYGAKGAPYLSANDKQLHQLFNKDIGGGNRVPEDILDLLAIWLSSSSFEERAVPDERPPTVYERSLRRCTRINDVVLDVFGGTGSLLIACEQLKRVCHTMEPDPALCDLILTRYEKLTGTSAILVR